MTFGKWPDELHYEPEQLLKIERARQISSDDVHIDVRTMSGHIIGSKKPNSNERHIYSVDANSCTCGDFIANKRPCKHMYRIAIECGLINAYSKEMLSETIGALENLPDDGQRFLQAVLGVVAPENYGTFWVEYNEDQQFITRTSWRSTRFSQAPLEWLTSNPYLDLVPASWQMLPIREILDILELHEISVPDDLMSTTIKDDIVRWIEKNVLNNRKYLPRRLYIYTIFHQKAMFQALTYLRRKFDSSTYAFTEGKHGLKVSYPSGAIFDKPMTTLFGDGVNKGETHSAMCHFPDDEVTELLTLYGHNRCLNGFNAIAE